LVSTDPGSALMTTNTSRSLWRCGTIATLIFLLGGQHVLADAIDSSVDAYVRDVMAKRHIPGMALAVIRQGRVERVASYGVASLEFSVPVTPTTLFHVASVTKSFTAVAIMKLVEAGKLKLDDPIGTYLEGLP
jgi:CubicO group peptidase (beta-lactamase class C family)